mmetsp:Transcript_58146/g.85227  ORF Transcript_58146/g.85227 Transcript_58146/m.85227 type:complete len:240 (+) Transcript_58146:325-1044(+)
MCQKRHAKIKSDRKKGPAVKLANSTTRVSFLLNQFLSFFLSFCLAQGFKLGVFLMCILWQRVCGDAPRTHTLIVHHVLGRGRELGIAFDDLVDGLEHVLFCDLLAARANGVHSCLRAHRAQIRSCAIRAQTRQKLKANVAIAVHVPRVNFEDLSTALQIWHAKLYAPVHAARAQQRRVKSVWPVGGHEHLNVTPRIETIQLVDNLKHSALHLVVTTLPIIVARSTNGIDLVEEDNARLL